MSEMKIEDYLSQGGKLTSPGNVPPRYRGELMRLMASFVDSELAGAAGFADTINDAPGIRNRIAAAKITQEKLDHAGRVLDVMGEFGADTARYDNRHDWAARMDRDADLAAARHGDDMRLSVFHYPIQGYVDAVVLNVLMGLATVVQMEEMKRVSYAPLADACRDIAPRETAHVDLGLKGLRQIVESDEGRAKAEASVAYWMPRVEASFGQAGSARFEKQARLGLRHTENEKLREDWAGRVKDALSPLGLG
ncbi:Phenylacetic acid catabolic protein [Paracoccus sediminicola]|uniref:Phenylacetic acid catabolic protein n=1 Tax=Paracoccus sediminicola TaxID=3017783 RepID=UPI0022F0F8E4|nr:Phenylacetic acid catabolic protein [Paracoccus sediminicola]WBU55596.1 phenylacetate-CoA oxygenase subunit PaaI [Paracoccus sediminicola]